MLHVEQTKGLIVPEESTSDITVLVRKAEAGDKEALSRVIAQTEASPHAAEIWKVAGDLAQRCQNAWIDVNAGENGLARESIKRVLAVMRAELEGPNSSPLERILVDRILITWLQVNHADREDDGLASFQVLPNRPDRHLLHHRETLVRVRHHRSFLSRPSKDYLPDFISLTESMTASAM